MNLFDKVIYFYIKKIKKWMECPVYKAGGKLAYGKQAF